MKEKNCEKCESCKYDNGVFKLEVSQHPCCVCNYGSCYEEYIGENLYPMKQYPIERRAFEQLFTGIDKRLFWEGINEVETDSFKYWKYCDEFYILHKESGTLINWYKHLGRCNTCNKNLSIEEYNKFIIDFMEELDFWGI